MTNLYDRAGYEPQEDSLPELILLDLQRDMDPHAMDGLQELDVNTNEPIQANDMDMQTLEDEDDMEDLSFATDIEKGIMDVGDQIKKDIKGALCTYVTPDANVYNLAGLSYGVSPSPTSPTKVKV